MDLVGGIMIAFHRAFEMGHERRTFDRQIVIVFHGGSFQKEFRFDSFPSSLPGLTRQSIVLLKTLVKGDGCAGQARA
jgi:transcription elongation factor GreA-like protein